MSSSSSKGPALASENSSNKDFDDTLLAIINRKLGIVVKSSQLSDLHKIINDACIRLHITQDKYLNLIDQAVADSSIMKNLINSITIGETYFFRDQKQMQLLKDIILPEIIQKKRLSKNLTIRIWSAGCASGEELYSIIIMLNEMLKDRNNWELHFLGTDINAKVLQKALVGEYSDWSMRSINDYYKNKYLKFIEHKYYLDRNIIHQAQFHYLNLNDESYPSIVNGTNALDLILCRNVLIYFDKTHTQDIMKKFNKSLLDGGYLLLGASDPIEKADDELVLQPQHGKLLRRTKFPAVTTKIIPKIENKVMPLVQLVTPPVIQPSEIKTLKHADVVLLAQQENWSNLLATIENIPPSEVLTADIVSFKAEALANLGRLKEAAACCEVSLKMDSINLKTYFTYAMILIGLKEPKRAEAALRKTLFLDRDFVLGHYQLGLLLMRNEEDLVAGLKSLKNAYTITQAKNADIPVPGYENLSYGKLSGILQEEIQLHESGSDAHEAK